MNKFTNINRHVRDGREIVTARGERGNGFAYQVRKFQTRGGRNMIGLQYLGKLTRHDMTPQRRARPLNKAALEALEFAGVICAAKEVGHDLAI